MIQKSILDIRKIRDILKDYFPVEKKSSQDVLSKQKAKENLKILREVMDTPGDIAVETLLRQMIDNIPSQEKDAELKQKRRLQVALILSSRYTSELISWAHDKAVYPLSSEKGKFLSELVTATLAKNSKEIKKHLGMAIDITQGDHFISDKLRPETLKLIKTVTNIRPKSSLLYDKEIKHPLAYVPLKSEIYASVLKKKPHMLTTEEKLDVARSYTVKTKVHINGKDMFRKQQDMGVLKALQSSPAEERLKIISLMKTTEPTAQDNMIKASV
ncbi:MAG TPA: hypothetical protein VGF14_06925, partial [Alphaproteobacteria bacterium]